MTAETVTIRAATPDDAALVHQLTLAAYKEYCDRLTPPSGVFGETIDDVRSHLIAGGGVIVFLDGEPAACGRCEVSADGREMEVGRLAVLPAFRRRGIATRMLTVFEERAAAAGVPEVLLGVRLALPGNIALYQRAGYRVTGYEDHPTHGRISVWMRKSTAAQRAESRVSGVELLRERLKTIIDHGPATGGVAVRHIERGESVSFDGDTTYPTASVFKVPVLVEAFCRVGAGEIALDDRWELTEADKSTGSGVLTRLSPGLQPTVRDLLTLMIIISDNTATDILVRRLGPERITATMEALGLSNTVVANTCIELVRCVVGDAPPSNAPYQTARAVKANPPDPNAFAYQGTRDNNISTANEMAELFLRIHTGEGMDAIGIDTEGRAAMRDILLLQQLNERLPRFIPGVTPIAHKTGSLSGPWAVRNDAGLIDMGDRGTAAIAVFTRTRVPEDADATSLARLLTRIDEEIGEIARAVYQHYTA